MADRTIPEDETTNPMVKKPAFMNPNAMNNVKMKARRAALKARVLQGKNGTAHEQHLAHEQHVANVKNNPKKYS